MKGTRQQSEGFTFVELLVVIAIIGILAGLLLPAISTGRGGRCQFNLRQIQMSYSIAVNDNSDRFGARIFGGSEMFGKYSDDLDKWTSCEDFWVNNWGLREYGWICPSAPPREKIDKNGYGGLYHASSIRFVDWTDENTIERTWSYIFNGAFDARGIQVSQYDITLNLKPFVSQGDVQHPSQTPIWGDGYDDVAIRTSNWLPPWTVTPDHAVSIDFALPRHAWKPNGIPPNADFDPKSKLPGATNLSFADGHVEKVPLEKLWSLYWHRDYVPPAKRPGL